MKDLKGRYLLKSIGDVLLPRTCVVCGRELNVDEDHICVYCAADMPYTYFNLQDHNQMSDKYNDLIQRDLSDFEPYSFGIALFYYNPMNGYANITKSLKYHRDFSAGKYFSDMLADSIASATHLADLDLVIPIPLHWSRYWIRGYNQAEIIASRIAKRLNITCDNHILYRAKHTKTQTHLSTDQKYLNVQNTFKVKKSTHSRQTLSGSRHILLVDDVFTTGATVNACRLALRNFDATPADVRISIATLAFVG